LASIVGVAFTLVWTWFRAASGGIGAVVEGVVCGSAVAVAIQAPLFLRNCHWRITWNERLARTLVLAAPLLLGGVFKFEPQLDRYFASGMGTGVIAQLGYSKALVQAFLVLTVSSLSTVLFPVVARLAGERRHDELRRELERSLQLLALLLIPLSVGLLVLGEPFVAMLLERGEFTPDDSRVVTQLLILQIGVIVGGSLGEIFSKVYYALADTRTPVMIGLMGFALGIGLKFLWQAKYGADGLVTATSVYLVVTALVMGIVLVRSTGLFVTRHLLLTLGRAATAALLAGFVAHMVWSHAGRFAVVWAGLSGATIYALGLILLREPLAAEIRHVARLWRRPELSAADNALLAADPAGDIAPHTSGDAVSDGRMLGS
jgi:putative peptidoglycan lipid II flippase